MRKFIFLLLFSGCAGLSHAQFLDNIHVDNIMYRIPASKTNTTADIAGYIKQHFKSDRQKALAIYTWVTANIKYDTDSTNNINLGPDKQLKITAALRRRRGVCANYAAIFNDICLKAGITSFVVDGYTKQNGWVEKTGHSWCAVLVDNSWLLCDPTWDERTNNIKWFLVPPSQMIASHMPFDPMWQLLVHPVSHKQFYNDDLYPVKDQPLFNYADSIAAYLQMDSFQQFKATAFRIQKHGVYNKLLEDRLAYTIMQIAIINEERDVELYESSVADLNNATRIYNDFVQYRNNQFLPAISDNVLENILDGLDAKFSRAFKRLDDIDGSETTFKFSTEAIRNQLNKLRNRVKEQQSFLALYLNTAPSNRQSLFYSQLTNTAK